MCCGMLTGPRAQKHQRPAHLQSISLADRLGHDFSKNKDGSHCRQAAWDGQRRRPLRGRAFRGV